MQKASPRLCLHDAPIFSSSFAAGSWKMKQLDELLAKVSQKLTKYVFVHYLD